MNISSEQHNNKLKVKGYTHPFLLTVYYWQGSNLSTKLYIIYLTTTSQYPKGHVYFNSQANQEWSPLDVEEVSRLWPTTSIGNEFRCMCFVSRGNIKANRPIHHKDSTKELIMNCSHSRLRTRSRRALSLLNDVLVQTRRVQSPLILYSDIALFWFSTAHHWIVITPLWLSTDDIFSTTLWSKLKIKMLLFLCHDLFFILLERSYFLKWSYEGFCLFIRLKLWQD